MSSPATTKFTTQQNCLNLVSPLAQEPSQKSTWNLEHDKDETECANEKKEKECEIEEKDYTKVDNKKCEIDETEHTNVDGKECEIDETEHTNADGKECEIDEKVQTKVDGKECEVDGKELGDGTQKCEVGEKVNTKVDGQECDKEIDECGILVDGHFVLQSGKVGPQTQISEEKTQVLFSCPGVLDCQIKSYIILFWGVKNMLLHVQMWRQLSLIMQSLLDNLTYGGLALQNLLADWFTMMHKLQPLPAACTAIPKNIKKMKEVEHVCILFCSGKSCFCSIFWKVACNYSGQCCSLFWQYFVCV